MPLTIELPAGFEYVGLALSATFLILAYQSSIVGKARKRAGIAYPQLYAEKAEAEANREAHIFNCTQRAHQNTLESIGMVWLGTILLGLKHPVVASGSCTLYTIARIGYTVGYTTGNPDRRVNGVSIFGAVAVFTLIFGSIFVWAKAVITGVF